MIIELLALIAAICSFISALLKEGEDPTTIIDLTSKKYNVSSKLVEHILKFYD